MLVSGKASKFDFYTVDHDEKREGAMHISMSEVFVKIKPYYMEDDESQIFPLGTFSFRYLAFGYGKNTIDSGVVHFFNDHEALVLQNFFYHSVRDSQELFIRYFQCFCIEYAGKCWQVLTTKRTY